MDQLLFKNILYENKKAKRRIETYMLFESTRGIIMIAVNACLLFGYLFYAIATNKNLFSIIFPIILFEAAFIMAILTSSKDTLKKEKALAHGRDVIIENNIYDDKIEVVLYESRNYTDINDIKYVSILDDFIFIFTKANFYIILQNDSFTLGTYEDFINFLNYKGIEIK